MSSAATAPPPSSTGLALPGSSTQRAAMIGLALPTNSPAQIPSQLSHEIKPSSEQAGSSSRPDSKSGVGPASGQREANGGGGGRRKSNTPEGGAEGDQDGEDEGDEDDDDDEGGAAASAKKAKSKKRKSVAGPSVGGFGLGGVLNTLGGNDAGKEYRYTTEISQMMFVFGEVQDPLPETVHLVEDIVRTQIIEILTRARLLTHLRGSRYLSADDVIFLIRDDRSKVNRLRTYLSWKDVRKKARDEESGEMGGEGEMDDAGQATSKIRKTMVKLPWELFTPFSDVLKGLPSRQNREDDEDEDEDELQAYQDSMQRLRDADEITKKMTKDEYVHYSDCRQASFTYRKGKRFREFINFPAYVDSGPNDEVVDILGFLSFEMVRTLCVISLEVRERMEKQAAPPPKPPTGSTGMARRATLGGSAGPSGSSVATGAAPAAVGSEEAGTMTASANGPTASPTKRKSVSISQSPEDSSKRAKVESPEDLTKSSTTADVGAEHNNKPAAAPEKLSVSSPVEMKRSKTNPSQPSLPTNNATYPISLFAPPPSARQPLLPAHVLEAFAQIQREQAQSRVGGMRNFRGGMRRGRLALV